MSFSNFTCIQCARRLSRLAQTLQSPRSLDPRQAAPRLSRTHTRVSGAHRLYSTAPGSRADRPILTRDAFGKLHFTSADIPPSEFWRQWVRPPLVENLDADECHEALRVYAEAVREDAPGWQQRLITTDDNARGRGKSQPLSAYALYYAAQLLVTRSSGPSWHIARHIHHTLAGLDYVPSIFVFLQQALKKKLLDHPQFEATVRKFEHLLRRIVHSDGNKPGSKGSRIDYAADACTFRATIYVSENTHEGDNNALRWFRRAYEISQASQDSAQATSPATDKTSQQKDGDNNPEDASEVPGTLQNINFNPHWQWRNSFALGVGAIHLKRGKLEEARAMFAMAAHDFDNPTGYYKLAEVLEMMGKADTDEYVESLEKAAVSGNKGAARKLASREWNKAAAAGLSRWEKKESQVLADEWMAIADASVPQEV